LTIREVKELNNETKEYLCNIFPAAAWFVVLASSHDQELLKFPEINASNYIDIETIHVYTPKPGTLKLETNYPEGEYLLHTVEKPHDLIAVNDQKDAVRDAVRDAVGDAVGDAVRDAVEMK
jgi:hypothetical protein